MPLQLQYVHLMYIIKRQTRYVLFICTLPMAGRTAGPIKTKPIGTHVDPRSVLVKVRVIYLCVRYDRINDSDTWRTIVKHARSSSSRYHLVNANKTPYLGLFAPSFELVTD